MSKIIGIDLGTTNSCVSVMEGNEPVVITNAEGKRTTPSIIAFIDGGERKVGEPAKRQAITNPQKTIFSIKRFMGSSFDEVKTEIGRVPYEVVKGDNNTPRVKIDDRLYTPQEISAMTLQKMKKTAEDYLGTEVTGAVITPPVFPFLEDLQVIGGGELWIGEVDSPDAIKMCAYVGVAFVRWYDSFVYARVNQISLRSLVRALVGPKEWTEFIPRELFEIRGIDERGALFSLNLVPGRTIPVCTSFCNNGFADPEQGGVADGSLEDSQLLLGTSETRGNAHSSPQRQRWL